MTTLLQYLGVCAGFLREFSPDGTLSCHSVLRHSNKEVAACRGAKAEIYTLSAAVSVMFVGLPVLYAIIVIEYFKGFLFTSDQ